MAQNTTGKKKKGKKTGAEPGEANKNQEEFEAMKNKTKKLLIGMGTVIIAAIAGVIVYKNMH